MASRLELQTKLEELMDSKNVYFQPPTSTVIAYPCVIYNIGNGDAKRANNTLYNFINSYQLTIIYKKPVIEIIEKVLRTFQLSTFDRSYISDNLYHYVFTIYF